MKVFACLAGLLFAYSAVLQLNDPDPIRWFSLYAVAALLSAASAFVAIPRAVFLVLAGVTGLWALALLPGILSLADFTGSEEEREFAGLILVSVASSILQRPGARRAGAESDRAPSGGVG